MFIRLSSIPTSRKAERNHALTAERAKTPYFMWSWGSWIKDGFKSSLSLRFPIFALEVGRWPNNGNNGIISQRRIERIVFGN